MENMKQQRELMMEKMAADKEARSEEIKANQ